MAPLLPASSDPASPGLSSKRTRDVTAVPLSSAESRISKALRRKRRTMSPLGPKDIMLVLFTITLLASRASGALISKFDNCLSSTDQRNPTRVQFHPILVAAEYEPFGEDVNYLRATVWGTVTGETEDNPRGSTRRLAKRDLEIADHWNAIESSHESPKPISAVRTMHQKRQDPGTDPRPANASFPGDFRIGSRWPNTESIYYNFTAEIVSQSKAWQRDENGDLSLTAVDTSVMLSSFQVVGSRDPLCKQDQLVSNQPSAIVQSVCPMGNMLEFANRTGEDWVSMRNHRIPAEESKQNDVEHLTTQLPSFTFLKRLSSQYQFASLGVTMRIKAGDNPAQTTFGCIHFEITPALDDTTSNAVTWFAASTLILVGISCIVAAMFNPWNGTTDVFKWSTNYGMDHDMLRLVTPGFADCLQWLQFITLTGALSLDYPGFYEAVVAKIAWSCLLLDISFHSGLGKTSDYWVRDGLLVIQSWKKGFERLGQAVGLATVNDIWVSIAVWYAVILIGAVVIFQLWFWSRWVYRKVMNIEEGDLSSRNIPFTLGLMNRITFTWFLMPLLAGSLFQLVVAEYSDKVLVTMAAIVVFTLFLVMILMTDAIRKHRPRQGLWDNLPTLLRLGTMYNTYQETTLKFFAVQLYANVARAVVVGALQHSGVAQVSVLMGIEIVLMLSVLGMQPFHPETSMNIINFVFCIIRLITVMLQLAFIPSLNTSDAVKGWAGWIILGIHGLTLVIFFLFKAFQTLLEMILRGYRSEEEASRGGLVKVFGMRQLHRRKRNSNVAHRSSSITPTPMSATERKRATATTMSSRTHQSYSNSSAGLLNSPATPGEHHMSMILAPEGSQSGHGHSASASTTAGFTPTSPGPSGYGYLPTQDYEASPAGPYYRPPRTRRMTDGEQYANALQSRQSWTSAAIAGRAGRNSQGSLPSGLANQTDPANDGEWADAYVAAAVTAQQPDRSAVTISSNRGNTDYAVRESDFYYGVRGPALNTQPQRRLGTGPADPTGPVSTAKSWIKQKLGIAKGKEERGFSVVRSSRAPEQMLMTQREMEMENAATDQATADAAAENPIGVALTSPDAERRMSHIAADTDSDSSSEDDEPGPESRMLDSKSSATNIGAPELAPSRKPTVPRKSSKRKSRDAPILSSQRLYDPPLERATGSRLQLPLPFEDDPTRRKEDRELSFSSTVSSVLPPPEIEDTGRPASVGEVRGGRVGSVVTVDRQELQGSQAELVRDGSTGSTAAKGQ